MPRVLSDAMVSGSPDTHLTLATTPVQAAGRVVRLASGMRRDVADSPLAQLRARLTNSPISAVGSCPLLSQLPSAGGMLSWCGR